MSRAKVIKVVKDWHCPRCGKTDQTHEARPHTRLHTCPKLHGLEVPMVEAGVDATVVALEREDYLNGDIQTTDDRGRPIMAVVTRYGDGRTDVRVNAPLATVGVRSI